MGDPFVHLHVASGFSLRHGASPPGVLVERALEHEMDALALTDRDGTYGAVRFAKACLSAGIKPVLGVDLALAPSGLVPGPWGRGARGGADADPDPRTGRCLPRPSSAAGHLPGDRPLGLGGTLPARLRHPPRRAAGRAGLLPRPRRPARRGTRRAGPARAGVRGRSRRHGAAPRPRAGGARPVARAAGLHRGPRRAGQPPDRGQRARLGLPRGADGRSRHVGRSGCRAEQRRAPRRPHRRGDGRRPRRRPTPGAARRPSRRPGQRRGVSQVRQGDGRRRRGALPVGRDGPRPVGSPLPAGAHPRGGRTVRDRPARRPRAGRGALPRAGGDRPGSPGP